jgi:hypothetical protein
MRTFKLYGTDVMMNNPQRIFLTGLLLGALAVGAFVLRSNEEKLSGDQSIVERYGASTSGELDKSLTETRRSNPISTSGRSDDDVAQILQAIRDSLQRNDLASANVLLGAVQTLHKDDDRALPLQKELQAREGKADTSLPVTRADKPPDTLNSTRSASRSSARADSSRDGSFPAREHAITTPRRSRLRSAPQVKLPPGSGVSAEAASPALGIGRTDSISLEAAPTAVSALASAPSASELIHPTPSREVPVQPVQPLESNLVRTESNQGPKTREQVRAELERARMDGTIPRFGNPDPAGPGGLPSNTTRPRTLSGSE